MIIDTDTNTTSRLEFLKTKGVTAIGRYYAASAGKRLSAGEAAAISKAGLKIFTVFENSGSPRLTSKQGRADALSALEQAHQVGQPEGSAIYFALEGLPDGYSEDDIPDIEQYCRGLRDALGQSYKIGLYSDGVALSATLDKSLCDFAWLSASLGFEGSRDFLKRRRWVLFQNRIDLPTHDWDGLSVDFNEANGDFGSFSVPVPFAGLEAVAEAAGAALDIGPGWVFAVRRLREEYREGEAFARTVGTYQVYRDGVAVPELTGTTVERQGPGDNTDAGVRFHRRIEAGTYPLEGHSTDKYTTVGYQKDTTRPRPALGLENTGERTAILIHPAAGYGSTIGCINLSGPLQNVGADLSLSESTGRAIAVIEDLRKFNGGKLPRSAPITNSKVVVFDPPADDSLRIGARSELVRAWQNFLIQQGQLTGPADGVFGANTKVTTMAFQATHGLTPDGVAGDATLAKARELGFVGAAAPKEMALESVATAPLAPAQKPAAFSFQTPLVQLTRPDDLPVVVNVGEILHFSPVPASGPSMGPLPRGTRITFKNQSHLDVKELVDVMITKILSAQN